MEINPIQSWKQMDKKQKAATVAKAAVGAVAIGTVVAAGVMGKKAISADDFTPTEKFLNRNGEFKGIKKSAAMFAEGFKAMGNKIANLFRNTAGTVEDITKKESANVGEEVSNESDIVEEILE